MKLELNNINLEGFRQIEGNFCQIPATLIVPNHIGTKFTKSNKIFRSSVWDKSGNLLSASFFKFTNLGENPEHFPIPTTLANSYCVEKIDGSAAIFDCINDIINIRTRGILNYKTLQNAKDFELCLEKYPAIKQYLSEHPNHTLICEIVTPNMRIVINYGDTADLFLIGIINKDDYSLLGQPELDSIAKIIGVKRPKYFEFDSLDKAISDIQSWKQFEGICLYSADGSIHKIKSEFYLAAHRMKSELASLDRVIDMFFAMNCPTYQTFYDYVANNFDFELVQGAKGFISKVCEAYKEIQTIIEHMKTFVEPLKTKTRKEAALTIQGAYSVSNRSGMVFKLLDSKSLDSNDLKKLIYQVLKN